MNKCCVCKKNVFKDPEFKKRETPETLYIYVDKKGFIEHENNLEYLQEKETRVDLLGPNGEWIHREFCSSCFDSTILNEYRNFQKTLGELS